jgi:predicted transcriptional regulator YheO
MMKGALKRLQQIAKDAVIIDSAAPSAPSVSGVDAAAAIRMKEAKKTTHILVNVNAFRTIGNNAIRAALVRQLDETGILKKPDGYPRVKTFQVIATTGARRQSYMSFDRHLLKC